MPSNSIKGILWGFQALRLQARTLYNISTLTQLPLRHLELDITESIIVAGLTDLGKLAHLKTLVVNSFTNRHQSGDYMYQRGILPKLDLRACTNLYAVSFLMCVPCDLKVLQGCSVNLVVACKLLTCLRFAWTSCTCLVHDAGVLSEFLGATFTHVTCLKIDAYGCERDDQGHGPPLVVRLGENVKHLKSLSIQSYPFPNVISLDITGSLQLVSLEVRTLGELILNISDVASLAASLQEFCIQCDKPVSKHPQMQMLLSAVDRVDKGNYIVTRPSVHFGYLPYVLCWIRGPEPVDVEAFNERFAACSCSACWECLKRAGIFDRLLT